jgi:hypothetical protein
MNASKMAFEAYLPGVGAILAAAVTLVVARLALDRPGAPLRWAETLAVTAAVLFSGLLCFGAVALVLAVSDPADAALAFLAAAVASGLLWRASGRRSAHPDEAEGDAPDAPAGDRRTGPRPAGGARRREAGRRAA